MLLDDFFISVVIVFWPPLTGVILATGALMVVVTEGKMSHEAGGGSGKSPIVSTCLLCLDDYVGIYMNISFFEANTKNIK